MKLEKFLNRLTERGFDVSDDAAFLRMLPWTRFTYSGSGFQVALATFFGFPPTLWMNALFAALTVLMPHHMLEYFYNYVLRHVTRTVPLPANGAPTKFAFGMASMCLIIEALAFQAGYTYVGYVFGATLVFFSVFVCLTHICIPAIIYGWITGTKGCAGACTMPQKKNEAHRNALAKAA